MNPLLFFAPVWLLFELWQLVVAERFLGIRQIEHGTDPRKLPLSSAKAMVWSLGILLEWAWMLCLLFDWLGFVPAACMAAVWTVGFLLRRNCSIRWTLVILTFEGAIRIGLLLFLVGALWIRI